MKRVLFMAVLALACSMSLHGAAGAPRILKIDPPDWWADMPKPMLLVRGENLCSAHFSVSDPEIHVDRFSISSNCHWAELWLNASPSEPETVSLHAHTVAGDASASYQFNERKRADAGFAGFSSADAMYLIMTDRFADGDLQNDGVEAQSDETSADATAERAKPRGWHGGDLRGIEHHIDYIKDTGFTAVWFTPVYANEHEPDSYHGYGATDMYAVDPHYGTLADLQSLAAALHQRHMKLVLDTVPNHVGPQHPWVNDEPDPEWLHGTKADHHKAIGDFQPLVNPHAPWRDQRDVLQGWFADVLPDLNQENPATAQYLIENAIWWIEKTGADGLRIDTFPYVGRAFWHDFHAQIHGLYPKLTTVGEVFNCDATITSSYAGGVTRNGVDTGLDTPFDFPSYCALRDVFLKDAPMTRLTDVWRLDALFPHPERLVAFLGNHDTSRFASADGATQEKMRLAFAVLLTMRGMPQVYSGDEIGLSGGDDPDNRHDFPGGWPGATQNAFTNRDRKQTAIHEWVRQLLKLRAEQPALSTGEMQVLTSDKDVVAYVRVAPMESPKEENSDVLVVVNRSSAAVKVHLEIGGTVIDGATGAKMLLGEGSARMNRKTLDVDVPGLGVCVASVERK
ncbi:alpha-amylase family glycosyl hydrolase [Telmatobacter sp. DSM 110680]|uniref:Alpha-amylase family glycosyl hydrolase n=1 Tax=Telmatobacter sp. DSM 110680 TaxID=3036704 RepID=A0AAU7DR97_9BACT